MIYKILKEDYDYSFFSNISNLEIVDKLEYVQPSDVMIMGGDLLRSEVRQRLSDNLPTIYIHRGYLGNHLYKRRKWWRYSINGFANTKLLDTPYSRWEKLNLPKHPWKVTEVKNVLICPSKMTSNIWSSMNANEWSNFMIDKFPGAEVKIRPKGPTPGIRWATLWEDLNWADLVVAQSSAITAEAFWYGKKAISTHPCITWAAEKTTLEDWKNPEEPKNRESWHEHLAWSQFRTDEWSSGETLSMIEKYFGNITEYKSGFQYDFK